MKILKVKTFRIRFPARRTEEHKNLGSYCFVVVFLVEKAYNFREDSMCRPDITLKPTGWSFTSLGGQCKWDQQSFLVGPGAQSLDIIIIIIIIIIITKSTQRRTLGRPRRIVIGWILKKLISIWEVGLIRLEIGIPGESLWKWDWTLWLHKVLN